MVKQSIARDNEEILKLIRDLGGSVHAYKRERKQALKAIVSEIYSAPRITKMIKMMPSSEVIAGFALDLTTTDADGRAWNFDEKEMRDRARKKFREEEPKSTKGFGHIMLGRPLALRGGPRHQTRIQ